MRSIGFLIHPYSLEVAKKQFSDLYPKFSFLNYFISKISNYNLKIFYSFLPVHKVFSTKSFNYLDDSSLEFSVFMVPLFPDQFIANEKKSLIKIRKLIRIARKQNIDLVALGGFTSIIGNQGEFLSKMSDIPLTTGNTFTSVLGVLGILKSCKLLNKNTENLTLGIVGSTGDIGSAIARYLISKFKKVILYSRKMDETHPLILDLNLSYPNKATTNYKIEDLLIESDVVLLATSALGVIIDDTLLKKGSIVCDVSLPHNISREIRSKRTDIFVFDGGRTAVPFYAKINNLGWKTLFPKNSIYGCLAEAFILAFDNRFVNYSIGRGNISIEKMNEMMGLAQKYDFNLANFTCGEYEYSPQDFEKFRSMNCE